MRADRGRPGEPARPPRAALQPRPWLERIEPYRPGLHADSDDRSLASNESPLGASARVVTAITAAALQAHRYPDPIRSLVLPSNEHAIQRDPNEVIIGM